MSLTAWQAGIVTGPMHGAAMAAGGARKGTPGREGIAARRWRCARGSRMQAGRPRPEANGFDSKGVADATTGKR